MSTIYETKERPVHQVHRESEKDFDLSDKIVYHDMIGVKQIANDIDEVVRDTHKKTMDTVCKWLANNIQGYVNVGSPNNIASELLSGQELANKVKQILMYDD